MVVGRIRETAFYQVLGAAASNATVTINNQSVTRHGEYFAKELSVTNPSSAVYTQLMTVGVRKNAGSNQLDIVSITTGKVFVAKSPERFSYDADGNRINDGRFSYVWDGENRLVSAESISGLPSSAPRQKLAFGYDHQSRRVQPDGRLLESAGHIDGRHVWLPVYIENDRLVLRWHNEWDLAVFK